MCCYRGSTGPFVYPIMTKNDENIGYVQAIPKGVRVKFAGIHIHDNG